MEVIGQPPVSNTYQLYGLIDVHLGLLFMTLIFCVDISKDMNTQFSSW